MPSDYDAIRAENVARYGWDTAVLELLGQLYSDRTHFIFELIQNAEDAGATELIFELSGDRLEVRHDGRPFSTADVRGVCGVGQGTKAGDLTQIGKFGIGFKSVYAYTNTPLISSGDERFEIRSYVRPHGLAGPLSPAGVTTFTFPFDRPEVRPAEAAAEIAVALRGLDAQTLLFLRHLGRIRVLGEQVGTGLLERTPAGAAGSPAGPAGSPVGVGPAERQVVLITDRDGRRTGEEWLIWSRPLSDQGEPALAVELAFAVRSEADARYLVRRDSSPLVVFFPTQKETGLGFLAAGPYRTTPARDNVPEHDDWNQALVGETATLLTGVLAALRDRALLTTELWQALPLEAVRFPPHGLFRPLFDAVRETVLGGQFIPDDAGGYRGVGEVRLASDGGLRELLAPGQLGALGALGAAGGEPGPAAFVATSVTAQETPALWHYLRDELGVSELTPAAAVGAMTAGFLAAQPDEWIARLYGFLDQHPSLWPEPGQPGASPVIRLTDGTQVPPFTSRGRPAAYLPGPVPVSYPTVRPAVAAEPAARRFLVGLGFAEADAVAEVLDHVLPGYEEADAASLDLARHQADFELIAQALVLAPPAEQARLAEQVARTAFLLAENAATGEVTLLAPGDLYQRTPGLELYFAGNPDAWFAADRYGPWRAELRYMGVRETVRLDARPADELGHVIIAAEFARHERGLAGFDPDAALDGLEFALAHPDAQRSEFVWNVLLLPHRHLISGVVESSPRLEFADARRQRVRSRIGQLVTELAWLPAGDEFRRPADADLADLPVTFTRDEGLAQALGLTESVIDEANGQLGFPPDFLRRLAAHPDLVDLVERELRSRESGAGPGLLRLL